MRRIGVSLPYRHDAISVEVGIFQPLPPLTASQVLAVANRDETLRILYASVDTCYFGQVLQSPLVTSDTITRVLTEAVAGRLYTGFDGACRHGDPTFCAGCRDEWIREYQRLHARLIPTGSLVSLLLYKRVKVKKRTRRLLGL